MVKVINTRRAKSGIQPFRRTSQFAGSKGKGGKGKTGRDMSAVKCCYCNREGHLQQERYTRINKNAPCVNRNGKPFGNTGKLATVDDEQVAELDPLLVRHLNSFLRSVKDQ